MTTPFILLFGLMAIGFFAGRFSLITEEMNRGLSNILVYLAMPGLLVSSILKLNLEGSMIREFLVMTVMSILFFWLFSLLAIPYMKLTKTPEPLRAMVQLSMLSSNNGFMGFPIAVAFFGHQGLFFMVANNLAMSIVLWTTGVWLLKRCKSREEHASVLPKTGFRETLHQILNPNVISIFVGLALGIAGADAWVPSSIDALLTMVGGLATPLSMIYIGVTLSSTHPAALLKDRFVVGVAATRATIFLLIALAIVFALPIPALMKQILLLACALPSAAIVPIMTAIYGSGKEEATRIVVFSTILSLVSAPAGVALAVALFH